MKNQKVLKSDKERQKFARRIAIYIGILLVLNISETILTFFILDNGGYEANPVVILLLNNVGRFGLFILKCSLIIFIGHIGIKWTEHPTLFYKKVPRWTFSYGLMFLIFYYILVTGFVLFNVLYFVAVMR